MNRRELQLAHDKDTATQCRAMANEVEHALIQHAVVVHAKYGRVYAYEVDAFGNYYCIDDGNVPSLLSLPYIGVTKPNDKIYLNTRHLVLSEAGGGFPHALSSLACYFSSWRLIR